MAKPRKLTMGTDVPSPSMHEAESRVATLEATVEHYIPEFAKAIQEFSKEADGPLILHQDAFAAGYDHDEYTLLGMAVKYAGLYNVALNIIGRNEETFEP